MRKILLTALMVSLLGSIPVPAPAQEDAAPEMKPVIVVSVSGYDEIFSDIGYLGKLGGNPQMAEGVEGLVKFFTQGKGLEGLDKSRPWAPPSRPTDFSFQWSRSSPVTDLKQLMEALAAHIGEPEDAGDGMWELEVQAVPVFVKEKDGWAYISRQAEALAVLPEDPLEWLGDLHKLYDVAARVNVGNVPEQFRQVAIGQLQMVVELGTKAKTDDETEEEFEARKALVNQQVEQLVKVVNEIDQITVGFATDRKAKKAYIDVTVTAKEGSDTAATLAVGEDLHTAFGGFERPDAVVTMNVVDTMTAQETEQTVQMVEALRKSCLKDIDEKSDEAEKKRLTQLANDTFDVLSATLREGKVDGGMAVVGTGPFTFVAGGHLADGAKALKSVTSSLEMIRGQEGVSDIQLNVGKHKRVVFHSFKVALPEEEAEEEVMEEEEAEEGEDEDDDADEESAEDDEEDEDEAAEEGDDEEEEEEGDEGEDEESAEDDDEEEEESDDEDDEESAEDEEEEDEEGEEEQVSPSAFNPDVSEKQVIGLLRRTFGEQVEITIGIGKDRGFIAVGADGLKTLKEVIDQSEKSAKESVPPMALTVRLGPIIKRMAENNPDDPMLASMAASMTGGADDQIQLIMNEIPNGMRIRLEAGEGVLPLLGMLTALGAAGGGVGGF